MTRVTRRDFVKTSSLSALSGVATLSELAFHASHSRAGDQQKQLPIIDTHQHLWDLTKFRPPWLDGAPDVLAKSYVTKDYLAATKGLNVVKAVYMEVDVDPRQQVAEAEHVIALSRSVDHPTCGAVISGRPNSAGFKPYISNFKDNSYIKGVRQVLHGPSTPQGICLQKQFVASMNLLGSFGKSFDLCMRPTELADGARLVAMCPDTRFIVDHCGNADPKSFLKKTDEEPSHTADGWRRDLALLAKHDNVICKISGIIARAPNGDWKPEIFAPIVNFCLDEFGPDRVVFGGDWPVCLLGGSYSRWVNSLKSVISNRSLADQRKLLHDNAQRIYSLA